MFISGRNFAYDRALRVIEDEEYLDDIDFVRAHHIFSQILNLRIFFHVFLKQKAFFFNKRFISVFFVYFDTNRKLLLMSCP